MYKNNKERKINYPHQKTVVTSTIVRTQNFNNSELLRVNHTLIDSKSSSRSNNNNNGSVHIINNRANGNINRLYNNANSNSNNNYNPNLNRNHLLKPKNSSELKQGTQPSSEERRLEQRQKQIEYGKNTIGYKTYIKVIKKENRKKTDPWTPDKYTKCSKRCWDGMVRSWRRQLHNWDPVNEDIVQMNVDSSNTLPINDFNNKDTIDLNSSMEDSTTTSINHPNNNKNNNNNPNNSNILVNTNDNISNI